MAIAADPGHAVAHYNLGILLKNERRDIDGAEAAYRAAIAADPGHAVAHYNLGILLSNERGDVNGAEAAYRAAIAADSGYANAHTNLGILLEERAETILQEGDSTLGLAAALALYEECAQLWGFSRGAEHEWTQGARAEAARLRAAPDSEPS